MAEETENNSQNTDLEKEDWFVDPYTKGITIYTDRTRLYRASDFDSGTHYHLSKLTDDGKKIEKSYLNMIYNNLAVKVYPFALDSPILSRLERRAMFAHQICLGGFYGNAIHLTAVPMVGKTTYLKAFVKTCSGPNPAGSRYSKKFDKIYVVSFRERYSEIIEFEEDILDGRKKEDADIIFVRVSEVFGNPKTGEVGVADVLLNAKRDVAAGLDVLLVVDSITRVVEAESAMIPFGGMKDGGLNPGCESFTAWWYDAAQQFTNVEVDVDGEKKKCSPSLTFITTNLDQAPGKPDKAKGVINGWVEGKADCHIYLSPEAKRVRDYNNDIITPVDLISSLNRSFEKYLKKQSYPKGIWYPAKDNDEDDLYTRIKRFENKWEFAYSQFYI
jgi:hypothetical protein